MNGYNVLFREDWELGSTEGSFINTYLTRFHVGWRIWTSMFGGGEAVM